MPSAYLTAISEMQDPGCWHTQMQNLRREIEEATVAGDRTRAQRKKALLKTVEEMYEHRFGKKPEEQRT